MVGKKNDVSRVQLDALARRIGLDQKKVEIGARWHLCLVPVDLARKE